VNITFEIKWVKQPVAQLILSGATDAESIGQLNLRPISDNTLLLEILQARLKGASYRRSDGPIGIKGEEEIITDWGMTSYEDLAYLSREYFDSDPWSFELIGKELPPVEDDEIEGMMMS
jgi:hypothetical protein